MGNKINSEHLNESAVKILILGLSGSGKTLLYDQLIKYFTGYDRAKIKLIYQYIEDTVERIEQEKIVAPTDYKYLLSLLDKKYEELDLNYILYLCRKYQHINLSVRYTERHITEEFCKKEFIFDGKKYIICDVGDSNMDRKQWNDIFKDTHIVIYMVSLIGDIDLSLNYYSETINGDQFKKSQFIVIFAHRDLYKKFFVEDVIVKFPLQNFYDIKLVGNLYEFEFIKTIGDNITNMVAI